MRITRDDPAVRTFDGVRAEKDRKLGRGEGMSLEDAWALLHGAERVVWILGELSYLMTERRFHIWIQGYAEREFDGPRHIAALAEAGEGLDPEAAAIFRWVAERGQLVRDGKRGEALFSVVPYVWGAMHDRCIQWMKDVVERWPAEADLGDLAPASAHARPIQAPAPDVSCRFPGALFSLDGATDFGLDALLERATYVLWQHGVSDDDLDGVFAWAPNEPDELVRGLAEWMTVTATEQEIEALQVSVPSLTEILGVDGIPSSGVVRVPLASLDSMLQGAGEFMPCTVVGRSSDTPLSAELRSAARMDFDLVFVDTKNGVPEDAAQMITNLGLTGTIVVLGEA